MCTNWSSAQVKFSSCVCAACNVQCSVVFAGFSAESLADRIIDASCKIVITADEVTALTLYVHMQGTHMLQFNRGGRAVPLKRAVDEALFKCPSVEKVLVLRRTSNPVPFDSSRDIWLREAMVCLCYYPDYAVVTLLTMHLLLSLLCYLLLCLLC
jgi:acetyl-CoA synthetase